MNVEKITQNENTAVTRKIKRNKEILKKIENKITKEIFLEIAGKLKKTLPTMILNYKEPVLKSDHACRVQNSAYNMLLCSNGLPKNQQTNEYYHKFAAIMADYIIKTRMHCIHKDLTKESCQNDCNLSFLPMDLETLKRNAQLLKIAEKLITSEQLCCQVPAQTKIQNCNLVC